MAALDNDVFFATIKQLNQRLLAREFSAVELARAFALRLEQLGPRYNALALPLVQEAIRQAQGCRWRPQTRTSARPSARHSLRREGPAELRRATHHLGRQTLRRPGLRLTTPR